MKHFLNVGALAAALALTLHPSTGAAELSGKIAIDGSSTVYPITEAVAEEFREVGPDVDLSIGVSGTGGGFKKFAVGETDISNASRPISDKEIELAKQNGVDFYELPVAFDGLTVVVNPNNDWLDHLTVAELKAIWEPDSKVTNWSDVRAGWPERRIKLYGAGHDSGTFDYFTYAINGKEKAIRTDFTASEDDNVLVSGVAGDRDAMGFFGYAYYEGNKARVRAVPVDNGKGPVTPTYESVKDGSYQPLSRPIFIYVSKKAAARPEVKAFVEFYLQEAGDLVREVGFISLPDRVYELALVRFEAGTTGTIFEHHGSQVGLDLEQVYTSQAGK